MQNQLNSEKAENDSLRDRIRKLENENKYEPDQCRENLTITSRELSVVRRSEEKLHQKLLEMQDRYKHAVRMQQLGKLRYATSGSITNLWHDNFVNDEYVIAYELNSNLDSKIKRMLPKVRL